MPLRTARERARQHKLKALARLRLRYPDQVIRFWKEAMRERIEETQRLAGFKVFRGDCHGHSTYSDGIGTVAEIAEWIETAGLDFFFLTDHQTVRQKVECVRHRNMWWGQEPGTQHHHLGILGIDRKFRVRHNLTQDYQRAIRLGGFPFIPHPTGWFPRTRYRPEQIEALNLLGDDFTIEVVNGANNIFDCVDVTDDRAIQLWDHHLSQGKVVRGMGNTDAHLPQTIGDVWNGLFVRRLTKKGVLEALWAGHFFSSDGPLINLTCGNKRMGDIVRRRKGSGVAVRFRCVDSLGLQRIRIIADGKVVRDLWPRHERVVQGLYRMRFKGGKAYVRVECYARDNRRAMANPIYVREP